MNQLDTLFKKNQDWTNIIGYNLLGYVGLPLMWTFLQYDMPILGFDIDEKKVENLKSIIPYIKYLESEMMETLANSDKADAILLCVPTPLDHHREQDMSYVEQATKTVSQYLRKGQLVILESTTWPGTESIEWSKEIISGFDAIIISTNHSSIDYTEMAEWSDCIVDTRNAMGGVEPKSENHIFKA